MLLKDFVVSSRARLAGLYPEAEARAVVSRLCEELLGVGSHAHIIEPDLQVPDESVSLLSGTLDRIAEGEPLQYVLGYADFCGHRFRVTPSVLIPRPETEQLCSIVLREAERVFPGTLSENRMAVSDAKAGDLTCCSGFVLRKMKKGKGEDLPCDAGCGSDCTTGSGLKILDLCTGSGCIAWTLSCAFPGAYVAGADISPEALAVASGQKIALPDGCCPPEFFLYDVLSGSDGFSSDTGSALCGNGIRTEGENCPGTSCEPGMTVGRYAGEVPWMSFDIIVSNPPYVRESEKRLMHRNVLEHEPGLALFVPDDDPLLFYRAIADFAGKRLNAGGFGAVEINEAFGEAVAGIFSASGLHDVRTVEDFRAKIRFVTFRK